VNELFGIPLDTLLLVLAIGLGIACGILGVLAIRNPVLVRLGVRNFGRRRARTGLIVLGLMLGTTIVAAALVTGDTMSHTIRTTATAALGESDEVVSAKGAVDDIPGDLGDASGVRWFPQTVAGEIRSSLGPQLADGVLNVVVDNTAMSNPRTGKGEPSAMLFGADPSQMEGFSPIVGSDGKEVSLADLPSGEAYLNTDAADELGARPGDTVIAYPAGNPAYLKVRDVVEFKGAATADAAVLLPLSEAQILYGRFDEVLGVMISNRGTGSSGVTLSDEVAQKLGPTLQAHQLEIKTIKQDAIEAADEAGSAFMAFFTTFGSFSIAAGILLIFLIFVMLAAERRGELGIARAIGTRRGHLTEMFTFEGAAYDLVAAAVGAILGAIVAYGMVLLMARAFGAEDADAGLQVQYAFTWRSLLIAFALGVLLTLVVVAFSAWRVSTMTIATAIRNLPEPPVVRRRRRVVLGGVGLAFGVLLMVTAGNAATPLMLGVSLVILMQYATVLAGATTRLFGINNELTLRHFTAALTSSRNALVDTIGLGVAASIVSAVVGVLIAYFVARTRAFGRGALDFTANLPLAIPGTVIGLGFALAFNHRPLLLTGTAFIIVIAFSMRALPYAIRSGIATLQQLHPSLDEASTNLGATREQTLWRVLLPLVRPAIIAGMIFTFTRSVTTLSAVIFVVSPHWSLVTPTILSQMDRGDLGEAAALSVILVVLVLAVIHGVPRFIGRDWREQA